MDFLKIVQQRQHLWFGDGPRYRARTPTALQHERCRTVGQQASCGVCESSHSHAPRKGLRDGITSGPYWASLQSLWRVTCVVQGQGGQCVADVLGVVKIRRTEEDVVELLLRRAQAISSPVVMSGSQVRG